jgi:hypothetical protein
MRLDRAKKFFKNSVIVDGVMLKRRGGYYSMDERLILALEGEEIEENCWVEVIQRKWITVSEALKLKGWKSNDPLLEDARSWQCVDSVIQNEKVFVWREL